MFGSPAEGWMLSSKRGKLTLCTCSERHFWAKAIYIAAAQSLYDVIQLYMQLLQLLLLGKFWLL